jgi:hypothetical protein
MRKTFCLATLAMGCLAGCDKSGDQGRTAALASANGLMPGGTPTFEEVYVVDQVQVKTAPKRTVSYEPLAVSGAASVAKTDAVEKEPAVKPAKKAAGGAKATPAKSPAVTVKAPAASPAAQPHVGGNFWKNVGSKTLMGGGGNPGKAPNPTKPAAKTAAADVGKSKPTAAKPKTDAKDDKSKKTGAKDKDASNEGDEDEDSDKDESDDTKDDSKDDDSGG